MFLILQGVYLDPTYCSARQALMAVCMNNIWLLLSLWLYRISTVESIYQAQWIPCINSGLCLQQPWYLVAM